MAKFKDIMIFLRMLLVAFLFIAMAVYSVLGNYGMAIVDLLLIVIFELQEINDKLKL